MEEVRRRTHPGDWEQHARIAWVLARLALRRGLVADAREHYTRATTLFERMGLVREVRAIDAELADLAG